MVNPRLFPDSGGLPERSAERRPARTSALGRTFVTRMAATTGLALTLAACGSQVTWARGSNSAARPSGSTSGNTGGAGSTGSTSAEGTSSSGAGSSPGSSAGMSTSPQSNTSPGSGPSVNPGGPVVTGSIASPAAQVNIPPPGAKLVAFEGVTQSQDGRTLYLLVEARGGACGVYEVVLQQATAEVQVGLASVPSKVALMCPMIVRLENFPVHLSTPLGARKVIDMADGQSSGPVGVL
jgi:hypothetical protein